MIRTKEEREYDLIQTSKLIRQHERKAASRSARDRLSCLRLAQLELIKNYYPRMDLESKERAVYTLLWLTNGAEGFINPSLRLKK